MTRATEHTTRPSFPVAAFDAPLPWQPGVRWQVLCGDNGHWRLGVYAPPETSVSDVNVFERHDCPELFVLMQGKMSLVFDEPDGPRVMPLTVGVPVLVHAPHGGFCPDGPHTGVCMVIERDAFTTWFT
jgi:hypothetical protein